MRAPNTRRRLLAAGAAAALVLPVLAACSGSGKSSGNTAGVVSSGLVLQAPTGTPTHGGKMTVLLGSSLQGTWTGLDPGTDTEAAGHAGMLDAIFGDLFEQNASGQIVDDLASGYSYSDGGSVFTISLRPQVTFSDGTPFNAQAVAFNFRRDLSPKFTCPCKADFPVSSVSTPNPDTVVLRLTRPFAPLISAFPGQNMDYIASPTALQKMGEKAFALKPVGAGPFTVARNPHYWQAGLPYLDGIKFEVVANDTSAYDALVSGQAQVYGGYGEYATIPQAARTVNVYTGKGVNPDGINFNTTKPPFNNILAREAIAYATDPQTMTRCSTQ